MCRSECLEKRRLLCPCSLPTWATIYEKKAFPLMWKNPQSHLPSSDCCFYCFHWLKTTTDVVGGSTCFLNSWRLRNLTTVHPKTGVAKGHGIIELYYWKKSYESSSPTPAEASWAGSQLTNILKRPTKDSPPPSSPLPNSSYSQEVLGNV